MDRIAQCRAAARNQRLWASQALVDARYNYAQAKRDRTLGNYTLARSHQHEGDVDMYWYHRRLRWAKDYTQCRPPKR